MRVIPMAGKCIDFLPVKDTHAGEPREIIQFP